MPPKAPLQSSSMTLPVQFRCRAPWPQLPFSPEVSRSHTRGSPCRRLPRTMSPQHGEGSTGDLAKLDRGLCRETAGAQRKVRRIWVSLKPFMSYEGCGSPDTWKGTVQPTAGAELSWGMRQALPKNFRETHLCSQLCDRFKRTLQNL